MFKLDAEIIRGYINDPNIGYEKVEKVLDAAHAIRYSIGRSIGVKELSDEEIRLRRIKDYKDKISNRRVGKKYFKDSKERNRIFYATNRN